MFKSLAGALWPCSEALGRVPSCSDDLGASGAAFKHACPMAQAANMANEGRSMRPAACGSLHLQGGEVEPGGGRVGRCGLHAGMAGRRLRDDGGVVVQRALAGGPACENKQVLDRDKQAVYHSRCMHCWRGSRATSLPVMQGAEVGAAPSYYGQHQGWPRPAVRQAHAAGGRLWASVSTPERQLVCGGAGSCASRRHRHGKVGGAVDTRAIAPPRLARLRALQQG